jgi:hypothetical protein
MWAYVKTGTLIAGMLIIAMLGKADEIQMEDLMSAKITKAQIYARINDDPDMHALGMLPIDSFARHAYQTKNYPSLKSAYSAANADEEECGDWNLTADEWVEEIDVARLALAHDMKIDLMRKGLAEAV